MRVESFRIIASALAVLISIAGSANASDGCCAHCGCKVPCQKVCRLVCEEKKVETICWACKCEDFCAPGPSKPGCKHCDTLCETCDYGYDSSAVHAAPHNFVWREWIPGCHAHLYTRKKLMQKTVTTKVPTFKWVVEELCPRCEANCPCTDVPPGVLVPPPPLPGTKLKQGPPR